MKKSIIMFLILTLVLSTSVSAMQYSENGFIDGEASQVVTKTLFNQDFENTGIKVGSSIAQDIAWKTQAAMTPKVANDPNGTSNIVLKVPFNDDPKNTRLTNACHVFTQLFTSENKLAGFVDGVTYTVSADVYLAPVDTTVTSRECELWFSDSGGNKYNVPKYKDFYGDNSIPTFKWTTLSLEYTYEADRFVDSNGNQISPRIRIQTLNNGVADLLYVDNVRFTYNDEVKQQIEVPWLSFEDFENDPIYSKNANSSQIIGVGGNSYTTPQTGVIEFANAKSGNHVAALIGKSSGVKSNGSISVGTSYRLKFYNLFNQKTRTPLNGTDISWSQGWEMFTEADIGRIFEISLWLYADSKDGAYPTGSTQAAVDGYISGDKLDLNNDATYPTLSVGLNGPGSDTKNDSQSYKYGGNPKTTVSKKVKWNEWTEFKVYYEVTKDTIYDATQSSNPLINAIGVNTVTGDYFPCTYYVDDIKVKEINGVIPSFSLVSNSEVALDVFIPDSIIDSTKNQILIAGIYDSKTQNLVDAKAVADVTGETVSCQLKCPYGSDAVLKIYLWDGSSLVPYTERTISEIPAVEQLKKDITIDRISQSFNGDVYTQKGFNWYTTGIFTSEIAYVEKTGDTPDFTNATYQTAVSNNERHGDFNKYSSIRHRAVVKNLKPNTEYYYKVGNREFNVWSNVFTFKTVDNSTTDGLIYLLADPQSSSYSVATPKGVMMDYIYETHPDGDFILSAGDNVITYSDEQQWIDIFKAGSFANPNITFNGTPGDHDTAGRKDGEAFKEQPYSKHFNYPVPEDASKGITYYSFDYKDMHIAVIDTTMLTYDGKDIGNSTYEQLNWLKADMNASDKKWKVVITHEQPQANTLVSNSTTGASYRRKKSLMPVFSELGIDLVLGGDTHCYSRTYPIVGLGGDLDDTTKKVVPFEGKTELGNPNPKVVKTEVINGKSTKFFDATEGVTYVTLHSVATNSGGYDATCMNPETSLIPSYDVLHLEVENFNRTALNGVSMYSIAEKVGDDIIISVYIFDLANPEAGGVLYDQFALTKK